MVEWWRSDSAVDDHYRNRWESIYGYDPLDPEIESVSEAEYEDEITKEKYDRRDR